MSLLEEEQQEMMLALCLTGFCSAEAGKNSIHITTQNHLYVMDCVLRTVSEEECSLPKGRLFVLLCSSQASMLLQV